LKFEVDQLQRWHGVGDRRSGITTTRLPNGTVGTPYTTTLHATGGISPWTWAITAGSLPAGLTLSTGGTITGTPTTPGTRTFTVQAADHDGNTATKSLTLDPRCPGHGHHRH
jgi:large repetitive protein